MLISQAEMDAICNRRIRQRSITHQSQPKIGSLRTLVSKGEYRSSIVVTILDVKPSTVYPGEWLVKFARGDTRAFLLQDVPVFLSKDGGYTTRQSRQAVPGDPEVAKCPGAAENARVMALARRQAPAEKAIIELWTVSGALKAQMTSMKARNRCKVLQRELERLKAELPVAEIA